jgi:hypothetical protein
MAAVIMLTEVKLGGVDVTAKLIKWKTKKTYGYEIMSCELEFPKTIDTLKIPDVAQAITIKRGVSSATDQFIFDGEVVSIEETGFSYKITGNDKLYDAIKKEITYSYDKNVDTSAGQISAIFKDLVNTHTDLVADDTSVQATGTLDSEILRKFVCRHEDVFSKMKQLADLVSYQFYYDPTTALVYFEPQGFTTASATLEVGTNVANNPKWKKDNSALCNRVIILGATQDIETTESGRLDVTTGWTPLDNGYGTLNFKPVSVKVFADGSDPPTTLRVGGVPGATTTFDYSVDFENKKLIWETDGGYAWAANQYVQVQYTHAIPVPISAYDPSSITAYGEFKRTFSPKLIQDVNDAELEADKILSKFSQPFNYTTLAVEGVYDLDIGQTASVIDIKNGVNSTFVINTIEKKYPHAADKLTVGDRELKTSDFEANVVAKIQELEQLLSGESDFLVHLIDLSHSVEYAKCSVTIFSKSIAGITGIYGHPTQGIYGLAYYGRSGMIWGHPIFGIWGDVNWGDVTSAFILGHPTGGVLGSDELGAGNQTEWVERESITYTACE